MGLSPADLREIKSVIVSTFSDKCLEDIADKVAVKIQLQLEQQMWEQQNLIGSLQNRIHMLAQENSNLQQQIDMQEQNSRNLNLRVFGLSIKDGEDLREETVRFFNQHLKINIQSTEIQKCHTVSSRNVNNINPPAVLVSFLRTRVVQRYWRLVNH